MVEGAMEDVGEMDEIQDPVRKLVFYTKILGYWLLNWQYGRKISWTKGS